MLSWAGVGLQTAMAEAAENEEWQGGKPPGGISLYKRVGREWGWRYQIEGTEAENLPRGGVTNSSPSSITAGARARKLPPRPTNGRLPTTTAYASRTSTVSASIPKTEPPISSSTSGTGPGGISSRPAMSRISRCLLSTYGASEGMGETATRKHLSSSTAKKP